ncbi:MAG: SurA N-terminal domain-containing protein [Myxococcota bacterium]|nr:SurA N-terminal domain-containing protein [Myxococcota bacterium]
MLTDLREKSQNFLVYILFGILIFVFIFFFGPQADGCQPNAPTPRAMSGWAATVNGEDISVRDVNLSVYREKQFNEAFPDEPSAIAQLSRSATQQLIEQTILAQQARKMGISVSEDDITKYIVSERNVPDRWLFRDRKGRIAVKDFRAILTGSLGVSPEVYRHAKKRELTIRRYLDFLVSAVKVSDAEIKQEFDRKSRSWNLEYVNFSPEAHKANIETPSADEIAAFKKDKNDAIKGYYEKNILEYKRDKEVKVSRVLIRKPKDKADKAGIEKAKAKATELLAKAKAEGADFGAIAKESSEGWFKTRGDGGDMGWQTSKRPGYKVFETLEKGQISDIQEESGWFYFVKATDIKPALDRKLESVTDEIAKTLIVNAAAAESAKKQAAERLASAKKTGSLSVAQAPQAKPEDPTNTDTAAATPQTSAPKNDVQTTGMIKENRGEWSDIPGIGKSELLASALPKLSMENPLHPAVIEAEGQFFIVKLKERIDPKNDDFEKEKADLKANLMAKRAYELFGDWNQVLFGLNGRRQQAKRGALLADLRKGSNIKVNDSVFATRTKPSAPPPPAPASPEKK